MGYIYGLCAPGTDEIRYVGQTTTSLKQRLKGHMLDAGNPKAQCHRVRWIRKVGKPTIVLLEETDDLDEAEIRRIAKLRADGLKLVNTGDGGKGSSGVRKHSPETRAKMSASRKGRKITWGDKISASLQDPETREKLSQAARTQARPPSPLRGRTLSDETRAKLSKAGKRAWAEGRGKNGYTHSAG